MEQKPVLSLLFYCTMLILGLFFVVQGIPSFITGFSQRHRSPQPAVLEELKAETLPTPHGLRRRLSACRYRYQFQGKSYLGQRFSLFESQRYSKELPAYIKQINDQPFAYVDPASPLDAVLLLDPPLSSLLSLTIGLLFFHCGAYFSLLWLFKQKETRHSDEKWKKKKQLPADRHPLYAPLLVLPGTLLALFLLFSYAAVPGLLSSQTGAVLLPLLYFLSILWSTAGLVLRLRRIAKINLTRLSWSPNSGLQFRIKPQETEIRARLKVKRLIERRFSWRYRKTGSAEFEIDGDAFTLAPYSFKPSPSWHRPLGFLFTALRTEEKHMTAESEALCQILAGQSSNRKSRSPLMGLMRKRPDHRLEIHLQNKKLNVSYSLPVAFWTSEISR